MKIPVSYFYLILKYRLLEILQPLIFFKTHNYNQALVQLHIQFKDYITIMIHKVYISVTSVVEFCRRESTGASFLQKNQ